MVVSIFLSIILIEPSRLLGSLPKMITTNSFVEIAEAAALKGLEPLQKACLRFAAKDETTQSMLPDSFRNIPISLPAVYPDVRVSKVSSYN